MFVFSSLPFPKYRILATALLYAACQHHQLNGKCYIIAKYGTGGHRCTRQVRAILMSLVRGQVQDWPCTRHERNVTFFVKRPNTLCPAVLSTHSRSPYTLFCDFQYRRATPPFTTQPCAITQKSLLFCCKTQTVVVASATAAAAAVHGGAPVGCWTQETTPGKHHC